MCVCGEGGGEEEGVCGCVGGLFYACSKSLLLQVEFWAQHASFILVGVIVITSVRGLLITLTKVSMPVGHNKTTHAVLTSSVYI